MSLQSARSAVKESIFLYKRPKNTIIRHHRGNMAKERSKKKKAVNLLFSCVGRRVSLLRSFRKAAKDLGVDCLIVGTDMTHLSPAMQKCDQQYVLPPIHQGEYLENLLNVVKKHEIDIVIPTIDLELKLLAKNRSAFEQLGARVLVSEPGVVDICQDKRETYRFLTENSIPCPETMTIDQALEKTAIPFPRFLKPWDGYASRGNAIVNSRDELRVFGQRIPNCIVQEFAQGQEYTCDAYVDFEMNVRTVVPRMRIEVRTGEVSKAKVVQDHTIMEKTAELVKKLKAGPGVITIQLICKPGGEINFIEINPRFGGGAPLSIRAGANFPKWILAEMIGKQTEISFNGFRDNLVMLRYDDEVWLQE